MALSTGKEVAEFKSFHKSPAMNEELSGLTWNLQGLIGSAFGGGAWMALTPFLASWPTPGILVAWVLLLALLIAVPALWSRRANWSALKGLSILLAITFGINLSFLLYAHFMSLPLVASWPPLSLSPASNFFPILLIFPALALLFCLLNQSSKKAKKLILRSQ